MAEGAFPDRTTIAATVVEFITADLEWDGDPEALTGSAPLRLPGMLDSQALIELAGFAESEFGVEIDDGEITEHTFGTVDAFAALIEAKLAGSARADPA